MQLGAAKVDDAHQQITGQISVLRNEVETLMGGWRGRAATSFVALHEGFEGQANKINQALDAMHSALLKTHGTYSTQEADQTAAITSMTNNINGTSSA
jgi:WXG100 family type VII secretion target